MTGGSAFSGCQFVVQVSERVGSVDKSSVLYCYNFSCFLKEHNVILICVREFIRLLL